MLLKKASSAHASPILQVVYPALDLKVKNVTHAYSVEHEDEVWRLPYAPILLCGSLSPISYYLVLLWTPDHASSATLQTSASIRLQELLHWAVCTGGQ